MSFRILLKLKIPQAWAVCWLCMFIVAAMTSDALSEIVPEVPVERKLIPLEAEAHSLTGLSRGRFAFATNDRIVIINASEGRVAGELLVGSPVVSVAGHIDTEGRQSLVVMTTANGEGNTLSVFEETFSGSAEFKRTVHMSVSASLGNFAVVGGGRTIISWNADRLSNGAGTIFYRGSEQVALAPERPLLAIVSINSTEFALALGEGSVSLLELRTGRFVAELPAKQFMSVRSLAAIAPPQRFANPYSPVLVVDTSQNLTLLGVNIEPFPDVSVLGQVPIEEKSVSSVGDLPILVADNTLKYILVRPSERNLVSVFRAIGTGIERTGAMDLGMPIKDATVLPSGDVGRDTFAFLSSDGRSVLIVPDPLKFGAVASAPDRASNFDPSAWPSIGDETKQISPDALETVRAVQLVLATLGYKVGVIDGIVGPATRSALKTFQFSNELVVTGDLDEATAQKLAAAASNAGVEEDPSPLNHGKFSRSENTIYVQFAGASREIVEGLMANLRRNGWNIPGEPERLRSAAGLNEVRYGRSADRDAAEDLADALTRAGFTSEPVVTKFVRVVRPKVLEVWISQ